MKRTTLMPLFVLALTFAGGLAAHGQDAPQREVDGHYDPATGLLFDTVNGMKPLVAERGNHYMITYRTPSGGEVEIIVHRPSTPVLVDGPESPAIHEHVQLVRDVVRQGEEAGNWKDAKETSDVIMPMTDTTSPNVRVLHYTLTYREQPAQAFMALTGYKDHIVTAIITIPDARQQQAGGEASAVIDALAAKMQ